MLTAAIGVRGCGEARTPGGVYAECGLSEGGLPLEHFLVDPPIVVPPGLDLVNKPQLWDDPTSGITHLLIWVGAQYYSYLADYIEEVRHMGASRKLSPGLDFSRLTPGRSCMVMVHPRARNTKWQDMALPALCAKNHSCRCPACRTRTPLTHDPAHVSDARPAEGPCLYKTYELIPAEAGTALGIQDEQGADLYLRENGGTAYFYTPHGEPADGLQPGIFAALPLTGFALVKRGDGTVNEQAQEKLAQTTWEVYEAEA